MHRLIWLLERWCERESIRVNGRGLFIPDAGFVWIRDALGRWHHGSYDGHGHFIPLQASFNLERATGSRENPVLDEFEVAFRKLDPGDQGLIVMAHFAGAEGWANYLVQKRLSGQQSEKRLSLAWFLLRMECKRRGLV